MSDEKTIKELTERYLGIPAATLGSETRIGKDAVGNSIQLHRFYAELGRAGFRVEDYFSVQTFGELLERTGAGTKPGSEPQGAEAPADKTITGSAEPGPGIGVGLGVDVEQVENLPDATDFRADPFYAATFTPAEISRCLLKPEPRASLAGLFAAKEALLKAGAPIDPSALGRVEIGADREGRPVFPGYRLSISHTGGLAVAVAAREQAAPPQLPPPAPAASGGSGIRTVALWGGAGVVLGFALAALLLH